jgi:hypothetical protein
MFPKYVLPFSVALIAASVLFSQPGAYAFPEDTFDTENPAVWTLTTEDLGRNNATIEVAEGMLHTHYSNSRNGEAMDRAFAEHTLSAPESAWEGFARVKYTSSRFDTGNAWLGFRFVTNEETDLYLQNLLRPER